MRILIVHQYLPFPADNGGKLRAAYLTRYLAARHNVSFACFVGKGDSPNFPESTIFADLRLVPVPPHASAVSRMLSGVPAEVVNLRSREMSLAVAQLVEEQRPDVLLTFDPVMSQYLAPFQARVRVLDYLMCSTLAIRRLAAIAAPWKRLVWQLRWRRAVAFQRRVASEFDLCLVNSQEDYDDLIANRGRWRWLEFLPNGLPLEEYPLGLAEPDSRTIVYPGSITYTSNRDAVEYLIDKILPKIRLAFPDVRLLVTGAIPDQGQVPEASGVIYTGRVPDVRSVIAGAWLCVVPLRSGAGGTRFKVLESMALGTPLVSTRIGAEGVDWSDGENLAIADTPELFADKTIELLGSRDLRTKLSLGGRQLIEKKYNWESLGDRVTQLLDQLVTKIERPAPGMAKS